MIRLALSPILLAAVAFPLVAAEVVADDTEKAKVRSFELLEGDRVVLLGGTLIEREQKSGYWETLLTARYPDRTITFRNLGWDGDTVWAESRGIFDAPSVGYTRMIEQVKGLKPTVFILGYGHNESFAGQEGLAPFVAQYEKLLDDLTKVSNEKVRFLLLLPGALPRRPAPLPDPARANEDLALYRHAISKLGVRRDLATLEIIPESTHPEVAVPLLTQMTDEGGQLTEAGYRASAVRVASRMSPLEPDLNGPTIVVGANGDVRRQVGFRPFASSRVRDRVDFLDCAATTLTGQPPKIVFDGLPEGRYRFSVDGAAVRTATAKEWATLDDASSLTQHPDVLAYEALRQAIVAKNESYFHSWRPQNVTYLFGFRKHEQGQNAKETAEFEKLVAEKEREIATLKKPVARKCTLVRIEEK